MTARPIDILRNLSLRYIRTRAAAKDARSRHGRTALAKAFASMALTLRTSGLFMFRLPGQTRRTSPCRRCKLHVVQVILGCGSLWLCGPSGRFDPWNARRRCCWRSMRIHESSTITNAQPLLTDACRVATVVALRGCGRDATISSTAVQLMVMDSDTLEACLYEVLHMASWGAWGGRRGGKFVNGPSTIWALMICRSLSSSWLVRPRCGGQSQMFAAYPDHGGGERPWGHAGMMNWPCRLPNSRCVA